MRTTPVIMAVPAAVLLLLLAGCVPGNEPTFVSSDPPTSRPTATGTPSPSATPVDSATPITIDCNVLITPQEMIDYNANFTLKSDYSPAPGSLGDQAVAAKGLACAWVNGTSGELIEVSAADLPEAEYTATMNELVTTSNPVPTFGVEGYFRADGGTGVAQAGTGRFWIAAISPAFFEPGDAAPLMKAAIAALG